MQCTVKEQTLSDGSKVYDIALSDTVVFHAISFRDACEFADKLTAAVAENTTDALDVYWNPINPHAKGK